MGLDLRQLDRFDLAILRLLQQDNQRSHAQIGEQVGLSGSAVRRRVQQLKQQGWIRAEVALLPPDLAGVTLLVTVRFGEESPSIYADFERQMRALAPVKQCYHTAGDGDYVLVVQLPNLGDYERWSIEQLMANPAIRRYDTVVVWSCKKFETSVDLDGLAAS
ncbi:MAG: Lrp/AsnC family transcriptional regulator [Xanthomonadales bacterium]|nr:Lrp/AsnC family transcriptional regulator [Xanthomonadales bacterium]MCB1642110.1 Lrp/AsnC family transcriptional regulator [Xanthomonadales bacterium]